MSNVLALSSIEEKYGYVGLYTIRYWKRWKWGDNYSLPRTHEVRYWRKNLHLLNRVVFYPFTHWGRNSTFKDVWWSLFLLILCTRLRRYLREKNHLHTISFLICLQLVFNYHVLNFNFHLCTIQLRVFFTNLSTMIMKLKQVKEHTMLNLKNYPCKKSYVIKWWAKCIIK